MADITNERMYEQLKAIRGDIAEVKAEVREVRDEVRAVKSHVAGLMQSDLNRDVALSTLTLRVEPIEKRLELND